MFDVSRRHREVEWMDDPEVEPSELDCSLRFIRRVNAWLGYNRATIGHLERFSQGWSRGRVVRIADFATGSGDVPRAILRWASRNAWDVQILAFDLHAQTARLARAVSDAPDARLSVVRADALQAPLETGGVDYAICSMFLHHLSDADATAVLREMVRVASRGIIVADLLRNRRAAIWVRLLTLFSGPMVRHDARVSVAQAFNRAEIIRLRDAAGADFAALHTHFAHRFVLAGEKPDVAPWIA